MIQNVNSQGHDLESQGHIIREGQQHFVKLPAPSSHG